MPYKIALDRGHGGPDPGAVKYVKEVDVATILTKQLEQMLDADENFTPILTCPYDKGLGITERVAIANSAGANFLICNHFNAGGGNGWEVYPEVPRQQGHPRYRLFLDSLSYARKLAALTGEIQNLRGDGGVQYKYAGSDAYFGIIRLAKCPAVLIENAFVDNIADISEFDSPEEILKLAGRQYTALCSLFGTTPLFDKNGKKISADAPKPPEKVAVRYRVYTEKNSFATLEEAVAFNQKENGIIICK